MKRDEIVVYEPNYRAKEKFLAVWLHMARNVIVSKDLVFQLFKRDFLLAYKRSFLGVGWIFISPFLGIVSWIIMNSANILDPGDVGMPYPAYILISTSIWGLLMGFYQSASDTLYTGLPFILDIKCPHEILLVKQTAQHLANFFLSFLLTIAVLMVFKIQPSWKIVFLPLVIVPIFFLGAGIGLVAALLRVVMPDIKRWLDFAMQLLMFFTPVVYAENVPNHAIRTMMAFNPLTYLIGGARDVVIEGRINHVWNFAASTVLAAAVFLLAARVFYLSEDRAIERMF